LDKEFKIILFLFFQKEMLDKLNQQENHDQQLRSLQNGPNSINRTSLLPRTGHTPEPPTLLKNTLTLAEKKRLQWQQEKGTFLFISKIVLKEFYFLNQFSSTLVSYLFFKYIFLKSFHIFIKLKKISPNIKIKH
jgi:hypothetical protein